MSLSRWAASKTSAAAAKLSASTHSIRTAGTTAADPNTSTTATTASNSTTNVTGSEPHLQGMSSQANTNPSTGASANNNAAHITSVIAPFLNPRLSTSSSLVAPPAPAAAPSPTSPRSPTFQQQHHLFDSASDGTGDQVWDTIEARVLPLFVGEGLNSTVEEINFLLSRYLAQQLYGTILEELKDLLREGVHRLMAKFLTPDVTFPDPPPTLPSASPIPASQSKYLVRWTEIWTFYFSVVLPYLQSVFLPLQAEIKGSRLVNSVRTLVLLAFRDRAVLPHLDTIQALVSALAAEFSSSAATTRAGVRISTLSLASLSPGGAAADAAASTTATPAAETRIAQLQQMLLVLGDLPLGPTAAGARVAAAAHGADEATRVKQIKAMQVPIKAIVARVRAQVAALGAAGSGTGA